MEISFKSPSPPCTEFFHTPSGMSNYLNPTPANVLCCSSLWKWVITPIAILAFPLVMTVALIATTLFCLLKNLSFQEFFAKFIVLPSLSLNSDYLDKLRSHIPIENQISVTTPDNVVLNGLELSQPDRKKWIVYFNGNRGAYETNYSSIQSMAEETETNILCLNYRGVGKSQGFCKCSDEILIDGKTAVDYLLQKGVAESDILIYGYSLGGGVGALVVKEYDKVSFVSDRSFSSGYIAVKQFFWLPVYRELMASIISCWWNIDAYSATSSLQNRIKIITSHQDLLVDFHDASLYSAFMKDNKTPPPTLHVSYPAADNDSCPLKCRNYAMVHYYDLPEGSFKNWIADFLESTSSIETA